MRGQHHIRQCLERFRYRRLFIENVQRSTGDALSLQRIDQVGGTDHAGPGDVHQEARFTQCLQHRGVDQVPGTGTTRRGNHQKIRGLCQRQHTVAIGVGQAATWLAAVITDLHVETKSATLGDGLANRPQAENAQALAGQRRADYPVPLATTG